MFCKLGQMIALVVYVPKGVTFEFMCITVEGEIKGC